MAASRGQADQISQQVHAITPALSLEAPEARQKNLTRRANHRHNFIIARCEPAPETGRGLFESDARRTSQKLSSGRGRADRDTEQHAAARADTSDRSKSNWRYANADPVTRQAPG